MTGKGREAGKGRPTEAARESRGKAAGKGSQRCPGMRLAGPRVELAPGDGAYPAAFRTLPQPPKRLYLVGDAAALAEGLAVVGARNATPYGIACAHRFAQAAAERGVAIISGGARGCDAAAHRAALEAGGRTVAFLGGGCDELYPAENAGLFQDIVDAGGAVVSEHEWGVPPLPYMFRARNRLIASLARATLIVEAGLPSGTFSTADEALSAGRDVLVVPGAITSPTSRGANRLLHQGAVPIVDDDTFQDALFSLFGLMRQEQVPGSSQGMTRPDPLVAALLAEPLGMDALLDVARDLCGREEPYTWLIEHLAEAERTGAIVRYPDARYGPARV